MSTIGGRGDGPTVLGDIRHELLRLVERLAEADGISLTGEERWQVCEELVRHALLLIREPERIALAGQLLFELVESGEGEQ